jgi:hypothetical protein
MWFNVNRANDRFTRDFYSLVYTTENDIGIVMEIHRKIIESRPRIIYNDRQFVSDIYRDPVTMQVKVAYLLNDGKIIERLYKYITPAAAAAMLMLDETDAVKNSITETFDMLATTSTPSVVYITNALFGSDHTLSPPDSAELFAALAKDVQTLPPSAKYFPKGETIAIISFPRISPDGGYELIELGINRRFLTTFMPGVNAAREQFLSVSTNVMRLFITEEYVHTLDYLNEMGILPDGHAGTSSIQSMYIERYTLNSHLYPTQSLYFRSFISERYDPWFSITVDASEYENILALARTHYFIAEGGYLVKILTRGGNGAPQWVTLFLPESDAPDFVRMY